MNFDNQEPATAEVIRSGPAAMHLKGAAMVREMAASQVRHAEELGGHAAGMGLKSDDNPFSLVVDFEAPLAAAWTKGFRK